MDGYWEGRGSPWEFDPGPARNRSWSRILAETPNYRALGVAATGRERFRWHFGPMFYRGRLGDGQVKVLVIGQEGAQDESLSQRSFTGGTGARMQHFLNHLGITESYLFLNTFVYPIYGQYGDHLRWLAQDPGSPIVRHRHELFDYVLERNEVHLIVAVGTAAKETVVTWIRSHGGTCSGGRSDVEACTAEALGPRTRALGVLHPGGAAAGQLDRIVADFKRAFTQVAAWADADPGWLEPDPGAKRKPAADYRYLSAPIPFRDFPFGIPWRLGRGGTSSNRKDDQRAIQLFSAGGKYNNRGDDLVYGSGAEGTPEGYAAEPGDLAYEPPRAGYGEYDRGPDPVTARLLMGGQPGLEWPDFGALGVRSHPSLGYGPIYRGRFDGARVLVLADQQSHDDLFTGRALCGDAGQRLQRLLEAIGVPESYVIVRVLPVDTLDLPSARVRSIVDRPEVVRVYQAIADRARATGGQLGLVLAVGPHARRLLSHLDVGELPTVEMKAWRQAGALADWRRALGELAGLAYPQDIAGAAFAYDGGRGQVPRRDLPYGTLRWRGTSGDRAVQPQLGGEPSPDYYKLCMPQWAYDLAPTPLSAAEQAAVDAAPA